MHAAIPSLSLATEAHTDASLSLTTEACAAAAPVPPSPRLGWCACSVGGGPSPRRRRHTQRRPCPCEGGRRWRRRQHQRSWLVSRTHCQYHLLCPMVSFTRPKVRPMCCLRDCLFPGPRHLMLCFSNAAWGLGPDS